MQLRPYQIKYIDDIRHGLAKHRRIIAQLPTGGGKTFAFLECATMAIKAGRTVLILSESRKIYAQIEKLIPNSIEINAGVKWVYISRGSLYLAMAQTLQRRPRIIEQLQDLRENLVIIADEAHLGTHTRVLEQLSAAFLVGITATPNYDDAKHLPLLYNGCICGPQISELIQDDYLCTYGHFARVGADMSKLEKKGGEFTEHSQEIAFGNTALFDGLVEDLGKFTYQHCMVFCASIKHAEDVAAQLEFSGIPCLTYHSQQPSAAYNLMLFETGKIRVLVSVGALTKGYDFPPVDMICLVRATTSLCLYMQMLGRGSRPFPDKHRFTVLDYGSHQPRFGLWYAYRDWHKLWQKKKKRKNEDMLGVSPTKECPECSCLIPVSSLICPFCGHIMVGKEKEMEVGVLVDLTEAYNSLIGRRVSTLTPAELAMYAKSKNKRGYAIRIARANEQVMPGWLESFAEKMGYKRGWVQYQLDGMDEKIEFHDIILK